MKPVFRINTSLLPAYVRKCLLADQKTCKRAMTRVKGLLVKGGRKRAPKLTGVLVNSITGSVEPYARSWAAFAYVPVNAASSSYAVPMHENHYQLGVKSQAKQAKQQEIVGRLYLQRSVEDQLQDAIAIMKDEINKASWPRE